MNQNEGFQIDFLKLAKALWARVLLMILAGVIMASAAFAGTLFFVTPKYDATASLYVNNSNFNIGATSFSVSPTSISSASSFVSTYIYILKSRTTLEDVAERAGLPYSAGALSGMITAKEVPGTAAFDVIVRCGSPTEAELIANTVAEVLPERVAEIVDGTSVRVVDYAIVPAHRSEPDYTRNTLIGFLAGVVVIAAIVAVQFLISEMNDMVIHSADELKELYPDIQVLAMIPDMRLSEKKGYYYSSYYGEKKKGGR